MSFFKKIIFFNFFCLLLLAYHPIFSFADDLQSTNAAANFVKITKVADIYNNKDQKIVGQLQVGTQIKVENITNGEVYFQWDNSLAYVGEEDTTLITDSNSINFTPSEFVNTGTGNQILTRDNTNVYSDTQLSQVLLSLSPQVGYTVSKNEGVFYTIIVGNRVGYIKTTDVDKVSTSNNVSPTDVSTSNNVSPTDASTSNNVSPTDASTSNNVSPTDASTSNNVSPTDASTSNNVSNTDTTANTVTSNAVTTQASTAVFLQTDKYFEVVSDNLAIYDSNSATAKQIGFLNKGQIYPRVADAGDWHQISFGGKYGYVLKSGTAPVSTQSIKNLNTGLANSNRYFIPNEQISVYDNTSGSLVPFASLVAKIQYPIINDIGDWYIIDVSGRLGYVYKPYTTRPFEPSDVFFKVTDDDLGIYDNSTGSLVQVGYLNKGQVYPRAFDGGDWHGVKFGDGIGYVYKGSTVVADGNGLKDLNTGLSNQNQYFSPDDKLSVYDNTSGSLVPFASLVPKRQYPIIRDLGDWYLIDVSGRLGYVYKAYTTKPFVSSDRYFQVTDNNVAFYDNSTGALVPVGYFNKGQVYQRVADFGDWHQIKSGNGYGYVWKGSTKPASSSILRNINYGLSNKDLYFKAVENVDVYDNSSGSLIPFASLLKDTKYPVINDIGDWYQIDISGRIGYVYKGYTTRPFNKTDRYFTPTDDNVGVYDNSSGSLVEVGTLIKGQIYPRVSDMGDDWHIVKFGKGYGYVYAGSTRVAENVVLKNENKGLQITSRTFKILNDITVYDNTSGSLVPFAVLKAGEEYPMISDLGDWLLVDVLGRIGYIYKDTSSIQYSPIIVTTYRSYNYSLDQYLSNEMAAVPQTDLYTNSPAYISKDFVAYLNDANHSPGYYVTADRLNVREYPNSNTDTFIYGTLKKDDKVIILNDVNGWYQILYTWRNAKSPDTLKYLDSSANSKFEHLRLDVLADVSADKLNNILSGKGILTGKGQSFKDASVKYGVNEVYLVSHALLETGNGTSTLSTGVPIKITNGVVTVVDPSKETPDTYVYNMYGIGAKDSCPLQCGAQTAYNKGWFTPEAAIIYGAEFVKSDYIGIGQNTIYKMRWNPDFIYQDKNGVISTKYPELSSATHQYATDIGWAAKQAITIENIYKQLEYYNAVFDIPVFK